ncbi:DUF1287 domain-containing protein [Teredinibacter purpureus]|uniref:DUF1287 domain-containing protein n=1 Tax=Teredinibacter purpureus TaxID=2731756 RepID=UPI000698454A|nr:DUF1287 domain-containing protein [Teredinibacter purpureus]
MHINLTHWLGVITLSGLIATHCFGKPFGERLSEAALERTQHAITYDGSYQKIDYPGGDVAPNIGVCTDVVIRSYRQLGIDLQQVLHNDIRENFAQYPSNTLWGHTRPDTNIDHRRVPNLETFFARNGSSLPLSNDPNDYLPGDIVSWRLSGNLPHIGIVTHKKDRVSGRPLVVHNIGMGPQLQDRIFSYTPTGHYRFNPQGSTP